MNAWGINMDFTVYAIAFAILVFILTMRFVLREQNTVQQISGPPSPSWLFGHMLQLMLPSQYGDYEFQWLKQFGSVYRVKGCFGQNRLVVADPLALQYILGSSAFGRAGMLYVILNLLYRERSVIGAQGDEHRRIRAALNAGFTATAVREYEPVFQKVAESISEKLETCARTNIYPLLISATLGATSQGVGSDIVKLTGTTDIPRAILGHCIRDLGEDFAANNTQIVMLTATQSTTQILLDALSVRFPLWLWRAMMYLPTTALKAMREGRYLNDHLGRRIVGEKLDAASKGLEMNDDLFSRLVDPDTPDKLSGADLVAQIGFILVAGQETTANAISFGLLELAKHPDLQDSLRAEITSAVDASAGAIAYDNMPLLNAFIKETIRLYPALPLVERVALQGTAIPLADPITSSAGDMRYIHVAKGQHVTLGIAAYQRLESRWGVDAHKFNPSRWIDETMSRRESVGPYANLLSFLGGSRTCLGWRFAILEMQVILCHLVAKFSFAQVEGELIRPRLLNSLLPIVAKGEKALPLRITRI